MVSSRLILGGHSFITQLGSDPAPDEKTQDAIVAACLDAGVNWFDTTYLPERVALGNALKRLGRRNEAQLIAWNFFTGFGPDGSVGGHAPYEPRHLPQPPPTTFRCICILLNPRKDPTQTSRRFEIAGKPP